MAFRRLPSKAYYRSLALRASTEEELQAIEGRWEFDPDQPRDPYGKFAGSDEPGEADDVGGGKGRPLGVKKMPRGRAPRAPAPPPPARLPPDMPEEHQRAVRAWLGPAHDAINAEARSGQAGPWSKVISDLDNAIHSAPPTTEKRTVWRDVSTADHGMKPGMVLHDAGFTSTSTKPLGGMEITIPPGAHALEIPDGDEMVLPRDSRFRVDAVPANGPVQMELGVPKAKATVAAAAQAMAEAMPKGEPEPEKPTAPSPKPTPPRFTKGPAGFSVQTLAEKEKAAIEKHLARFGVTQEQVQRNMDGAFAALAAEHHNVGGLWYAKAHDEASKMATQFHQPRGVVAGVIATFSPQTDWAPNLAQTRALLALFEENPNITAKEVQAVIRRQPENTIKMALEILKTKDVAGHLTGPKRRSFFINIADPTLKGPVTIDSHMIKLMTGLPKDDAIKILSGPAVGALKGQGTYAWFADQLRDAAERQKEPPHVFQAKLWTAKNRDPNFFKSEASMIGQKAAAAVHQHETPGVVLITAGEARGNSREVTESEFRSLAAQGKAELDAMKAASTPTVGLDSRWTDIKRDAFAEVQKSWGGATIDSHTGQPLASDADRFALTVKEGTQHTFSVAEKATFAQFAKAMDKAKREFRDQLARSNAFLGVFHDDDNHRIDIDPVVVVDTPEEVERIGAHTHAVGGAFHFKTGDGFFPPHVGGTRQQPEGTGVHFDSVAQWHSFAMQAQQVPVVAVDDMRSMAADGELSLIRYRSLWLRSRSQEERQAILAAVEKRRDDE